MKATKRSFESGLRKRNQLSPVNHQPRLLAGLFCGVKTPSNFQRFPGEIRESEIESISARNMNKTTQRLGILFFSLLLLAVSSLGCKTAEGFGKDVERAGEGIQDGVK